MHLLSEVFPSTPLSPVRLLCLVSVLPSRPKEPRKIPGEAESRRTTAAVPPRAASAQRMPEGGLQRCIRVWQPPVTAAPVRYVCSGDTLVKNASFSVSMYVHVCLSVCVCIYIYIYTHTHTHIHILVYIHTYVNMYKCRMCICRCYTLSLLR